MVKTHSHKYTVGNRISIKTHLKRVYMVYIYMRVSKWLCNMDICLLKIDKFITLNKCLIYSEDTYNRIYYRHRYLHFNWLIFFKKFIIIFLLLNRRRGTPIISLISQFIIFLQAPVWHWQIDQNRDWPGNCKQISF